MESPSQHGYQYQALSATDSIRLLTISRADDQPNGMLLSLKEARLDDQPDFAALSYTWKLPEYTDRFNRNRDSGSMIDVACDGKAMTISENLFDFLRAALHASGDDNEEPTPQDTKTRLVSKVNGILKDLPMWIDAFCINQSDAEEKKHQVLLMHRIYSAARNVIVWLGSTQPRPDVLWVHDKFIPAISKVARAKPDFVEKYLKQDPTCNSAETMGELGPELCSRWSSAWLQFVIYIDRQSWFDRGWIVQEVALSDPSAVYVCCGRSVLSWKRLSAFAEFLQQTGWSATLMEQIEKVAGDLRNIDSGIIAYPEQFSFRTLKISQARRSLAEVAHQTGLVVGARATWDVKLEQCWLTCANVLIDSLRSSRFGDDRDHIYGCLGMLSMLLPQGHESPIVPNYDLTVEEVFTATAGLFLTKDPLMTEFSRIEKHRMRRNPNLPSWVPDYSVGRELRPVASWNFPVNRYLDMSVSELRNTEVRLWGCELRRPRPAGNVLNVYGFLLDTVLDVGAGEPDGWQSPIIRDLIARSGSNNGSAQQSRANFGDFWETLEIVKSRYYARGNNILRELHDDPSSIVTRPMLQRFKESSSRLKLPKDKQYLVDSVRAELVDRYIYSTEGGEFGLGPTTVQEADEVWLLEGARIPCILRRAGFSPERRLRREDELRAYEFIGETDLRGFDIESTDLTSEASRGFYEMISLT